MASKALGNNPLFKSEPAKEETPVTQIDKATEPEEALDEFTTMSFKVRRSHLHTLRNYAYTNRLEIKEALDEILTGFFDSIDLTKLLDFPERPKKTRKKG